LHGGIERVLANKINYLVEQEHAEVFLITTEQKNNKHCYNINNKLKQVDLEINYNRNISYFNPKNFLKIFKHFFKLNAAINKIKPDVVIVVNYDYAFYFIPFIHRKSKKIKEFHSSRFFESVHRKKSKSFISKIKYRINDFVESKYDYLAVLTKDEQQHFSSKNTIVIPNGLEIKLNKISNLSNKTAISAGRIAPVKGFEKLILAWKIVVSHHPDWQLNIFGEGDKDYLYSLQTLVNKNSLSNNLCFCGQTKNLQDKMAESSIYIMSSHTECFPMVLLESKTVGVPIVSFDCPYGPKNIISNNIDGILATNQDEKALAKAIIQLIDKKELRISMGEQALINVEKFSIDKVMKSWIALFNNLLKKEK
jgi:glycosyltransferase involved in cell wall biosynthesis